jgi:2-methylcitrate dehydratase PrpD
MVLASFCGDFPRFYTDSDEREDAMGHDQRRDGDRSAVNSFRLTRRALLQGALAAGEVVGMAAASPVLAFARQTRQDSTRMSSRPGALALAQLLNRTRYADLPPLAVTHAKIIIASTLASAAFGSQFGSARILRDLAKEQGGKAEATIWFDGTRLPVNMVARVNAVLSDASASDDSDMRNTVHCGTTLTSAGLAVAERTGASGEDLLCAMVVGYEAAGRINTALRAGGGGRPGVHASQLVAFSGAVETAKLLKLTDEQMAHAIGITAITMGGISIGTNSWAREYMGANASFCGVNAALAAGRGYTVNEDMLEAPGGFFATFGSRDKTAIENLARDLKDWDILKYLAIKLVPGGHGNHAFGEAAANAARQANVSPEEVARILVSGPQNRTVIDTSVPKDMIEAIHSQAYFVASGVADKDFSWVHASDAKIHRPIITRLLALVEADPSPSPHRYEWTYGASVTIVTRSGARFTSTVDAPRGSAPRGIEWSDIDAKYRTLMPESKMSAKRIEDSLKVIHAFDQVKNVSELTGLLKTT